MTLSDIIKCVVILASIYVTDGKIYSNDELGAIETNDISRMAESSDYKDPLRGEVHLITKNQPIQKFPISLNDLTNDPHEEIVVQQIPVAAGILKAMEYINAHPDPQRHDESRRVKRF